MARIVVVDDSASVRHSVRKMLEENSYEVYEAENGKIGLMVVEEIAPDVVICDIFMPEIDGIEMIMALKAGYPGLPIIAMTSAENRSFLQVARKLGAAEALSKPFSEDELIAIVQKVLAA